MNDPQRAVLARLSQEFAAMSAQMARVSATLNELNLGPAQVQPMPYWSPPPPPVYHQPPPPPVYAPPVPKGEPDRSWIGKALAVAGVGVTLIGVVLLLVLAAQAGLLRPEVRVAAGGVLGAVLVGIGMRLHARPGGQVGAIALSATGIAALYMDIMAVTTIYHWVAAPVALVIGAIVGGGGLSLARRWGSEQLAVLVLVPLVVLAPVITDGVTLLLIGFMIALSAAALLVQIGRDWLWMHVARTAAVTLPLLVALIAAHFGSAADAGLLGAATGIAALLSIVGTLLLLPSSENRVWMAVVAVAGLLPALAAGIAVDRWLAALLAATVSVFLLAIVLVADRLPGVAGVVAQVWSAASAAAALVAVTAAFDGDLAAPVLLALGAVVAVAGRGDVVARWAATGLGSVGALMFVEYAPDILADGWRLTVPAAVSTLIGGVVLVVWAAAVAWAFRTGWVAAALVAVYGVTVFTVTAGVLVGGPEKGFLAGHMAATICWIGLAAALFVRKQRVGGLVLTSAAMAKLFLFDLGTLDGIFRVVAFIVVGLVLLAMGTGYARSLAARRDEADNESGQEMPLAPC
ncbi:putative membrane protein [Mycolicibacterium sp. BK556]|uniref:DUF2339 domain-containing protein n=1 Tax=unclassified Mycolicibacterium TaxID=2636767 RepID=UPI00160F05EE|nr:MULTISPECIES: DUF2339 domain-containing protein [unclassified Mycolicibacterium]MBB3606823.1 putative membrane protein [Mycolicibacterium sp. BK556]MBB3636511.1 putative membrane protein [Mycolicibacterium sp. BK607]